MEGASMAAFALLSLGCSFAAGHCGGLVPRGFGALLFLVLLLLLLVLLVPRLFVLGLVRALVVEDVQEGQVFGHFFTAEFLVFLVVFVCCWWCGVLLRLCLAACPGGAPVVVLVLARARACT